MLHLHLLPDAYELRLDGEVLSRLEGGAALLLQGAGERLREADIERAIERSEDWLMPIARRLQSLELRVRDPAGRLRPVFATAASALTVEQVEAEFSRTHEAVARGQPTDRERVADVVLLRELAHHGALSRIVLERETP